MRKNFEQPHFGDIYYAELPGGKNVQAGIRPVIIAQNDVGNKYSSTVEVIPMSTRINKARYMPTHVLVHSTDSNGLKADSIALAEQVVTIHKDNLLGYTGHLEDDALRLIGEARRIQSPFLRVS